MQKLTKLRSDDHAKTTQEFKHKYGFNTTVSWSFKINNGYYSSKGIEYKLTTKVAHLV